MSFVFDPRIGKHLIAHIRKSILVSTVVEVGFIGGEKGVKKGSNK